jgi:uncharacterized protein (TIGR03067 family)
MSCHSIVSFKEIPVLLKLILALGLFVSLAPAAWSDEKKDDGIDGVWLPSAAEVGGRMLPDEVRKSIKLEVKDGKYKVTAGTSVDEGTVKLDPSAKPKALDVVGTAGPNKGKTIPAIYERKGDTLRICYDLSGKNRPTEFKSESGTQLLLITYTREKP